MAKKSEDKSSKKNRRRGQNSFVWGEVDEVQQEEGSYIVPVKKPSKRRVDKRETTLTVENPQADLYKKKKKTAAVRDDGGLELPSYGMHLVEDEENDECSIFMHRAEEAEQRELLKRSNRSAGTSRKKGGDLAAGPAEDRQDTAKDPPKRSKRRGAPGRGESSRAEEPNSAGTKSPGTKNAGTKNVGKRSAESKSAQPKALPTPESDSCADFLAVIRAKATGKLRQFGFSDEWIRQRVPRRDSVEDALGLLSALLDARLRLVDCEPAPRPGGASVKDAADAKDAPPPPVKPARPVRGAAQAAPVSQAPEEPTNPFEGFEFESVISPGDEPTEESAAAPQPQYAPERPAPAQRPARKTKKAQRQLPMEDPAEPQAESAPSDEPVPSDEPAPFGGLQLSEGMLSALRDAAYTTPTPIQRETIPRIFAGVDLLGQSKTGSGKTAAFMIPIIEQVYSCEKGDMPVALIVVPTRELAVQIRDETVKLSSNFEIVTVACYGGKPIADQIRKMSRGVDIVIGTPGRILDLVKRRALDLGHLRWVVLDEADRMLDIGFRPDIERILKLTPTNRQTLLFSATLPDPVIRLAKRYMTDPETYNFSESDIAAETIEQFYMTVDRERKFEALMRLLEQENPTQAIIFCRTKRMVDRLGQNLAKRYKGTTAAIHGDLTQSARDRIMRDFRQGKIALLAATDVVGRGIDVSGISHIINYDIPQFCDDYVHRVGRTGRMGREGVAFTLVTPDEGAELTRIEMRINRLLKRFELKDFEAFIRPGDESAEPPKEPKPIYGRPIRRVRRAL